MRAIGRLLALALVVAMVSCSGGSGGSTVPVLQDYTSSAAPVHAKPQSVIPPYQPCSGPTCTGHGCSPGGDAASRVAPYDCVGALPGYNTPFENSCVDGGGIYISLENTVAANGEVYCASSGLPVATSNSPNGCPGYVVATWPGVTGSGAVSITGNVTQNYTGVTKGIRVSLGCEYFIDGNSEGTLLARRHF
jgi:hypothetical protein